MFQVAYRNCTCNSADSPSRLADLEAILDALDGSAVLAMLQQYRPTGRQGYPLRALWRAYIASFVLDLPHTNALIRLLHNDQALRKVCGFGSVLPHRTTFNRFIRRLADHSDLVESCLAGLTTQLKDLLPDLGQTVAVDSTTIRSHCNPHRKRLSDREASWTAKNSPQAKSGGKEWRFGYKLHTAVDAKYGLVLGQIVTTAKRSDSPELPTVIEHTKALLPWFRPKTVIADRGYDALSNHQYLHRQGIIPIIHIRKNPHGDFYRDIYTKKGAPTCMGNIPMEYVQSDPELGRLYRCRAGGCHLVNSLRGMVRHCDAEVWEDPRRNIRLFGVVRRDSPEWDALYAKRQSVERTFKTLKESRRLEGHCLRGARQITLHSLMSSLTFQATALVRVLAGESEWMRWMVRRVA